MSPSWSEKPVEPAGQREELAISIYFDSHRPREEAAAHGLQKFAGEASCCSEDMLVRGG